MKMQGALLVSLGLIHSLYSQTTAPPCCARKVVSAPSEYAGTYDFIREAGTKDDQCFDACVYSKQGASGEEYCFKSVNSGAATIEDQCDASVSPPPTTGIFLHPFIYNIEYT